MYIDYLVSLYQYTPELLLVFLILGLILIETVGGHEEKNKKNIFIATVGGLLLVLANLGVNYLRGNDSIFSNSIIIDRFGTVMKMILVLGTLGAYYLSIFSKDIYTSLKFEFLILALMVLFGGMILVSANNMLMLYIGVETLSIISYVMASLKKNDERSSEAGIKYALYGGISSGIMLFGMGHIFGIVGTIQFAGMAEHIARLNELQSIVMLLSFVLVFAGIGYKIAAVPFHMWSPDVYEGSPTPVTAFFAIVPKLAGISALTRMTMIFFSTPSLLKIGWVGLMMIIAALTMTVGNVSAIGQKSIKRMLAYSSISHAGVLIAGLTVVNELGVRAIVFYSMIYVFMTLVAFFITSIVQDKYGNDHFDRFLGLVHRYPMMAIVMAITMFSLTGFPPLGGFVAKWNILNVLLNSKYYTLAIVLVLNSVVSAYYYLKIVRLMMLKLPESEETIEGFSFQNQLVIVLMALPIIALGIFWENAMVLAHNAKIFVQ